LKQKISDDMQASVRKLAVVHRKFPSRRITSSVAKGAEDFSEFVSELNKRGKLHGIDHFVNKDYHPVERFLWLLLVLGAFYGVLSVGDTQLERFRANPTVISLERGDSLLFSRGF
jgi:Amiloride-sensitive sodium channel